MAGQMPSVGQIVHYVSYGTPGGEYTSQCRAAVITEVTEHPEADGTVGLCVLNPEGLFLNRGVAHADNGQAETPGDPGCTMKEHHGQPFRYCACGWREASPQGGTWHWPERT